MSDMADVLARRNFEHEWGGDWDECPKDAKPGWIKDAQETLDFLTAAGFGPVREAKADAWQEGWAHYRKHFSPNFPEFGINPYRAVTARGGE